MLLSRLSGEAHIWVAKPGAIQRRVVLDNCMKILSKQEREQCLRFKFAEDSHTYLVSHAMLRNVLSKYIDIPPGGWNYTKNEHGRPEIANPDVPPVRFNISHTKGLVACIVTLSDDCGIDVERLSARHSPLKVAKRMFSTSEYDYLRSLDAGDQLEYFFTRWTLREAYVKARGIGIHFPTNRLNFKLHSMDDIEIEFHPEIRDISESWQFAILPLSEDHLAAAAVRRVGRSNRQIIIHAMADDLFAYTVI